MAYYRWNPTTAVHSAKAAISGNYGNNCQQDIMRCIPMYQRILACRSHTDATANASSSDSTSYQFIQSSKLPTMYFQRSLPRLPVPLLERTCERYLAATQPLLSADAFEQTRKQVEDFRNGVGFELHALLKSHDAANKHTSYISEPWFDMYLKDRAPLPLNYNPLLVMKPDPRKAYQNQIVRASNLVISSLRFWRSLQANNLKPEVFHLNAAKSDTDKFVRWMQIAPTAVATYLAYTFKAYPLDMSQYNRLFGVSRIPVNGKDRLVQETESRHILVMRRGRLFTVDVLDRDGNIEAAHIIHQRLRSIVKLSESESGEIIPLGALTGGERDTWACTRRQLEEKNIVQLAQIDSALFCLCLDTTKENVATYEENNPLPIYRHLLAGLGTNRWFDKSVSLIVSPDGTAAINFEHSWGDGVAVLRYFNEIYKDSTEKAFVHPDSDGNDTAKSDGTGARELIFDLDQTVRDKVKEAVEFNRRADERLDINMLRFEDLGKNICKKARLSPDALMQLSFQLAYRQAYDGSYVGSYESCSTAAFRHGRTETIRPCTNATKKFCESLLSKTDNRSDKNTLRTLLQECSDKHGLLTKEAAMGQGFDRHLFALKHMAIQNDRPIHDLYANEVYKKLNHNIISTSTLSSNALLAGSFGPVVKDGLGIGYSIQNDECGAIVTSYKDGRDGKVFIDALGESFRQLLSLLK